MSCDVSLVIDTGGEYSAEVACIGNYTYNVAPIWTHALGVPERRIFEVDGSPKMCRRYHRESGEWTTEQYTAHGLRALDSAPCSEAAGVVARAVKRMEADPEFYRAMNPPNGWGDYEGALEFLRRLAVGCAEHPRATICVT